MTQTKRIIHFLVFVITASLFSSCEKKEEIVAIITESDAVEIIESALQSKVGGITTNLADMTKQLTMAVSSGQLCDTMYRDTLVKNHQGAQIQANYTSELSYEMTCNTFGVPQTANIGVLTTSTYDSPRIESEDDGEFSGDATGLQPGTSTLAITGNYLKEGIQDLNFVVQRSINSVLTIALTGAEIDKESYEIESGSGTFSFSGSTTSESFAYDGSIVFNGDSSATITINGTSYEVSWD